MHLGLDSSGFVRELQVLGQPANIADSSAERSREIRRLTALKAAAHFLGLMSQTHDEVKSEHVLVLADRWLAWVEQGPAEAEHPGGLTRSSNVSANCCVCLKTRVPPKLRRPRHSSGPMRC